MMNININNEVNEVIKNNEGLINHVLNRYFTSYLNEPIIEDMRQVGRIALFKSYQNFDESKGFKFSTFATTSIINNLNNFVKKDMKKYITTDAKSIYENLGTRDGEEGSTLENILAVYDDYSTSESEDMLSYIKSKNERNYKVAVMLAEGYTYEAIGKEMGISRQRVGVIVINLRKDLEKKFNLKFKEKEVEGKFIAFNDEGFKKEFNNIEDASTFLGVNKYLIKKILKTKKISSRNSCKNLNNIKVGFKFA